MMILRTTSFEIAANVTGNERAPKIAILLPGRLDTKDYANFLSHADYLATRGFYVIAVDPPGTWDSPGDLSNYSTSVYLKSVRELIDYFGNKPTLLLGHSRGGATAMLAASDPAVVGIVLVNAAYGNPSPPDPKKVENGILSEYRDLPPGDVRTKEQRRFNLPMSYFEDGAKHDPLGALTGFRGPKLLVHSSRDVFIHLDKVKTIYDNLLEPKMFLEIHCEHDYRLFPSEIESVNNALGKFINEYI